MKNIKYTLALAVLALAEGAWAQTSYDAERALGEDLNGTARYIGMGGAMGALGSDLSVISKNPAGIGTYTSGDMALSTSFYSTKTTMDNPGSTNGINYSSGGNRSDLGAALDNIGFVMSEPTANGYLNFAFMYRKVRNTDRVISYLDDFLDTDGYQVYRDYQTSETDRVKSFDFNLSGSCGRSFYWGVTLGMYDVDYKSNGYFYDYYPVQDGYAQSVDYTALDRINDVSGHGWNLKAGVIARPFEGPVRLGLSVATPQYMRLTEWYTDNLYALRGEQKDGSTFSQDIDFRVSGPWTFNASAGITFGRNALGFEYELADYDRTRLSVDGIEKESQGSIDFRTAQTMRIGYETNISKISLRAGFVHTTPVNADGAYKYLGSYNDSGIYQSDGDFNDNRCDFDFENIKASNTYTVGLGWCGAPDYEGSQLYIDAAYAYTVRHSDLSMHEYDDDPVVGFTGNTGKLIFTVGLSF